MWIAADAAKLKTTVTDRHGNSLQAAIGATLRLRLGLFENAALDSLAGFTAITVEVKPFNADENTVAIIQSVLDSGDINSALTLAQWSAMSASHLDVTFSGAETNNANAQKYLLCIWGTDGTVKKTWFSQIIEFIEDGCGENTTAPLPVESYYTSTEIDASFQVVPLVKETVTLMKSTSYASIADKRDIELLGYNFAGDEGGGKFRVDKADTTTADNGVTVFVASDGTRLKSINPITSLKQGGAIGDGTTDDTARITSIIAAIPSSYKLKTGTGNYKITAAIPITSKNISIDATGSTFTLVGDNAGFNIRGTVTSFDWMCGQFIGDSVNRDADSSKIQLGILIGNNAGDTISNVTIFGVKTKDTNNGIKITNGTVGNPGLTKNVSVINCFAENQIGAVGGTGYGFIFAGVYDVRISNSVADGCKRHGIYFSGGKGAQAVNCTIKNCGTTSLIRGAFASSRTADVSISNCVIRDNVDVGMFIDHDGQGVAPDNVCKKIAVSNCIFDNNSVGDISIGASNPATVTPIEDVIISSCTLRGTSNSASIKIYSGLNIKLDNITSDYTGGSGSTHVIIYASDGDTYISNLNITNCHFIGMTWGIEIPVSLATGTSKGFIINNRYDTTAPINMIGGNNSQTNPNLIIRRSDWEVRDYLAGSATPCVAGLDCLVVANAGPTTISDLFGGQEGQRVTLWFADGNTTISNANFHIASASYTPTADDTLTLVMANSSWREISRSAN